LGTSKRSKKRREPIGRKEKKRGKDGLGDKTKRTQKLLYTEPTASELQAPYGRRCSCTAHRSKGGPMWAAKSTFLVTHCQRTEQDYPRKRTKKESERKPETTFRERIEIHLLGEASRRRECPGVHKRGALGEGGGGYSRNSAAASEGYIKNGK